jgi:succinoglycan biosynthesis transport protein ExoP
MESTSSELLPNHETFDISQYIAMFWHWLWLIILITIITGTVAFFYSRQLTPIYSSRSSILVNEAATSKTNDYNSVLTSERLTRTYSEMLLKQPILNEVIQQQKLNLTTTQLAGMISVQPVRDTQLIDINVESPDPNEAARITNSLVDVFSKNIQSLQADRFASSKQNLQAQMSDLEKQITNLDDLAKSSTDPAETDRLEAKITQYRQIYSNLLMSYEQVRLSEAQSTSSVVQVEPAKPTFTPIRPRIVLNTILAAMIGMLLTIGAIVAFEALDDTIKTPDDITRHLGLPVLAAIMHISNIQDGKPITEGHPRSPISEAFRTLRTNVQYTSIDHPIQSILITSPGPEEGKTTVITNLGIVMAQSGRKVTIVDGDLRRPSIHKRFSVSNQLGLSYLFMQPKVVLNGAFQKTRVSGLSVITSGNIPPNPSELLGSQKMRSILETIKDEADIVLIDTPPTLVVTDASVLVPLMDGVVIVIKPGFTKINAAKQTIEQLQRVGANILGVVLNNLELDRSRYGYYYARKYHGYTSYYYNKKKGYYYTDEPKTQPLKKEKETSPFNIE